MRWAHVADCEGAFACPDLGWLSTRYNFTTTNLEKSANIANSYAKSMHKHLLVKSQFKHLKLVLLRNGGSRNPQRHDSRASHLLSNAPITASTVLWCHHRITSKGFWWACMAHKASIHRPLSSVHYIFQVVPCVSYPRHHAVKLNFSCTSIILALISPAMASAGLHFLWGEKAGGWWCHVCRASFC